MTDNTMFEYDMKKCSVVDWFPLGMKGSKMKTTCENVERWPEVDQLRYAEQIDHMKLHINACCRVIQRLGDSSDTQTNDP